MKGDNGSYIKITVKGSMIENIVQTNQIFFTFSENRMSTLPSENSLEDAYNRSFWMVCVLSVCVCAGLWLCVFTCLYLMMGQGDILHKIAPPPYLKSERTCSQNSPEFCRSGNTTF